MAATHLMTLSWQTWTYVAIVLVLVLTAALVLLG